MTGKMREHLRKGVDAAHYEAKQWAIYGLQETNRLCVQHAWRSNGAMEVRKGVTDLGQTHKFLCPRHTSFMLENYKEIRKKEQSIQPISRRPHARASGELCSFLQ